MDYAAESLKLHYKWQGKIEVTLRAPLETADDLSLAYTPGLVWKFRKMFPKVMT